jgi:ribonuclease-3
VELAVEADVEARLAGLQERIGVTFRHPELLREAMTHASWNNERGRPSGPGHDNERLEYLGDAVLELVVGEYLFRRFPGYDEGQLTQLRAALVNTISLARMAERLGLGDTLLLGKGAAKTGANRLPSLLANAFEATIGATFLDQGYRVAVRVFLQTLGDLEDWTDENFKGRLQETAQERLGQTPHYRVTATGGPGHKRQYLAEALVGGEVFGTGTGATKQAAEQAAAQSALERLRGSRARRRGPAATATAAGEAARRASAAAGGATPRGRRRAAQDAAEQAVAPSAPGEQRPARSRRRATEAAAEGVVAGVVEIDSTQMGSTPATGAGFPPASASAALPLEAPRTPEQRAPAAQPQRRRGLFSVLRSAAEAIVGLPSVRGPEPKSPDTRQAAPAPAPPTASPTQRAPEAAPPLAVPRPERAEEGGEGEEGTAEGGGTAGAAGRSRSRRGRRGGRGRRRPAGDGVATGGGETAATPAAAPARGRRAASSTRSPTPSEPAPPAATDSATTPARRSRRRRSPSSTGSPTPPAQGPSTHEAAASPPRAPRPRRRPAPPTETKS